MSEQKVSAYQPATKNKRVEKSLTKSINASVQKIFPLACPAEELKWIPGWEYDLIYSKSGVNETNCIFNEYASGPHFFGRSLSTTWVTALHDPENGHIIFQLNLSQKAVIQVRFECREMKKGVSGCTWHMVFTALDEDANSQPEEAIGEKMAFMLEFLSEALKHYCETGKMLS